MNIMKTLSEWQADLDRQVPSHPTNAILTEPMEGCVCTSEDMIMDRVCDEVRVPDEWTERVNPLHAFMRENFDYCLALSVAKNADYASGEDPLANFRACEKFGVPLVKGIMVRLSDKFARIGNLLDREAKVKDEKITDTIKDAQVYLSILLYALETE